MSDHPETVRNALRDSLSEQQLALRTPPSRRHAMHQDWLDLLFVHYALDPELIQAALPSGISVDTFPDSEGRERAWLGVVPFRMSAVRFAGWPRVPFHSSFPELNLRTYVHIDGKDPAVWFFSLNAPKSIVCFFARRLFHLPYFYSRLKFRREGNRIHYKGKWSARNRRINAQYKIGEAIAPPQPGSLEFFLCERYLLITRRRDGSFAKGAVAHSPYPLHRAELIDWDESYSAHLRPEDSPPASVLYSPGVSTRAWSLDEIE